MSDSNLADVARRAALGLPPAPRNNNHRRGDAHMDVHVTVPACGIFGVYAIGFVCGMGAVMAYHLIF
jgi:hypothetical protein